MTGVVREYGTDAEIEVNGHTRPNKKPGRGSRNDKSREYFIVKTQGRKIKVKLWDNDDDK